MATRIEIKPDYRFSLQSQRVLAVVFLCSVTIFILMSVCLMSSYWITAEGFRQGLLYLCIEETDLNLRNRLELPLPLPFDLKDLEAGCYPNRDTGYLKLCTFFCLIIQLSAMASAVLTGISMRLKSLKRARCLRFIICTTLVTLLCDIALIVTYPTQFREELDRSNRDLWELDSAYGLACGAAILAMGNFILLVAALKRTLASYEAIPTRL